MLPSDRRGIWYPLRDLLTGLDHNTRNILVEDIASFLTGKQVTFVPELLRFVKDRGGDVSRSEDIRDALEVWWSTPENSWPSTLHEFVGAFVHLDSKRRQIVLEESLKTGQFARDTLKREARQKLKEAFNTPLYPVVLVCNQVMEGRAGSSSLLSASRSSRFSMESSSTRAACRPG